MCGQPHDDVQKVVKYVTTGNSILLDNFFNEMQEAQAEAREGHPAVLRLRELIRKNPQVYI